MSPVWISIGIGLVTIVFTMGGAWALVQYRLKKVEADQKEFAAVIESLKETIREEFDKAIGRINKLLFDDTDGGTSRYVPRREFDKTRNDCRAELVRRVERLEQTSHKH